jgi:hypothetical protein
MQKTTLYTVLLLVGLMLSNTPLLAQISAELEPYFESYTKFITSNEKDRTVLYYQYDRIVRDTARLKNSLSSAFPGKTFSQFQFLIVGGYGTNTPVRSSVGGEGSDLDINMLFKINNGIKADISAYTFKYQVKNWLTSVFPNTTKSNYAFNMKDPVVEIVADTTFPDGTKLFYHMDIGSFNRLSVPQNPGCLPNKLCSEMAWGTGTDNDLIRATWNETASPSFAGDFNQKFPVNTTVGDKALSVCKMLKYWNKFANQAPIPDDVPPSLVYLIANYNWIPQWSSPTIYRLQQLIADVDGLRKNIFNNNCSSVAGAKLDVPFYTSMNPNVLNKMSTNALQHFCNSLKTLSDTLHFVANQTNLQRALLALSNVFPQFNNVPPGTYHITSFYSGKVIYPKNGNNATGDTIVQYTSGNESSKKWVLRNIETSPQGKFYYVITNLQSANVLNAPGSSTTQGTPMNQWTFNNGENQKWEIVFLGYDSNNKKIYQIINKWSNMLLDVEYPAIENNTRIIQWIPNGGVNQRWYFEE